jgi:SAM-dependent methyltransferase
MDRMDHELAPEIRAYYEQGGEDDRLHSGGQGTLELLRTRDILRRVLPPAPASVLDVGGGTGVHAAWLAADGYAVHVVDPVPRHVKAAAALPGVSAALGDARALSEQDGSYDVVLLLGPLYHLVERADRVRALAQARRVARRLVAAATISPFAVLFDGIRDGWYAERLDAVHGVLETGRTAPTFRGFTTAYFHRAEEVPGEFAAAGLAEVSQYAIEGPPQWMGDLREQLADPVRRELLLGALRRVEREPGLLGATGHLLTVGRGRL